MRNPSLSYEMLEDAAHIGLRAGDFLRCYPYVLDPRAKLTVLRREGDPDFEPESVNVYRYQVRRAEPNWSCPICFEQGVGVLPLQCPECLTFLH